MAIGKEMGDDLNDQSRGETLCLLEVEEMAQDCVEWRTVIFFRQGFPLCLSTYLLTYSTVQSPS